MATATSADITNCASCGGKLSYNFKTNRNKCEYCGNEYEAIVEEVKSGDQKIPLSLIPFKFTEEQFKGQVMHWLADGDFTPVDLLTPEKPYIVEQRYMPLYFFAGDYEGKYNVLSRNNRVEQGNIPISGKFEVLCYGGTQHEKEQGFAEAYIPFIDFSTAAPSPKASSATKVLKIKAVEPDTAWQRSGSLAAADQVYQQLTARDSSKEYSHYLKYDTQQLSCISLPFYVMEFKYNSFDYTVYTNGVTGELFGERPFAHRATPPTRWRTFWRYFGMGWIVWFLLVIAYEILIAPPGPATKAELSSFSSITSIILVFIIPACPRYFLVLYKTPFLPNHAKYVSKPWI